jgi:hypothetical protein
VHVTPHEITSAIDWPAVLVDAMVAPQQAAADVGWRPLVAGERQVLLAVRESPARQLWIGFDSPRWHDSADFVVFWAAALDWLGRGGERFAWQSVQHLPEGWRIIDSIDADLAGTYLPGLIRREDGSLLALNALDVQLEKEAVPSPDLAALDLPASVARALAAWVILLALIMCVAGVTLVQRWRGMPLSS